MKVELSFKKKMIKLPVNLTITENAHFYAISTTSAKNMLPFYIIAGTFLTTNNDLNLSVALECIRHCHILLYLIFKISL